MNTSDEVKAREALNKEFRAAAEILSESLISAIERVAGVKPSKSPNMADGSIWLSINEPRIMIGIDHDWGTGMFSRFPTGKPKVQVNRGYSTRPAWYRPGKDGSFNIEKISKNVAEQIEQYKIGQKATEEAKAKTAMNAEAQAKELDGVQLPEAVVLHRNPDTGTYMLKFGGTFENLSILDVAVLSETIRKLTEQYKFQKPWRGMDF